MTILSFDSLSSGENLAKIFMKKKTRVIIKDEYKFRKISGLSYIIYQ